MRVEVDAGDPLDVEGRFDVAKFLPDVPEGGSGTRPVIPANGLHGFAGPVDGSGVWIPLPQSLVNEETELQIAVEPVAAEAFQQRFIRMTTIQDDGVDPRRGEPFHRFRIRGFGAEYAFEHG